MYTPPVDRFGSEIFVAPKSVAEILERIESLRVTDKGKSRGHGVCIWHFRVKDESGLLFGRVGPPGYAEDRDLTITVNEDGSRPVSENPEKPWEEMTRQGGWLMQSFSGDLRLNISFEDRVRIYDAVYARVRHFIVEGK